MARGLKPRYGARPGRSRPLAQGLVAFWPLWEGAGPPIDAVSSTRATSNSMAWSPGPYGPGLVGNGTSTGVLVTPPVVSYSGPITLAALAAPAASFARQIFAGASGYVFEANSNGTNELNLFTNAGGTASSSASAVDGGWHVFAVTQSSTAAGGVQFYRDGAPWGTGTLGSFPSVTGWTNSLGVNGAGTAAWLKGGLGWALALGRALSPAEHAAIGASPNAIFDLLFPPDDATIVFLGGGIAVTASMAATLAAAAFAGSATTRDPASMAATLAAGAFAGTATTRDAGSMAATLAAGAFAGSAATLDAGSMAATLGAATFAGGTASFSTSATMATTLAAGAFAGAGAGSIVASMGAALSPAAMAAAAAFATSAAMSATLSAGAFAGSASGPYVARAQPDPAFASWSATGPIASMASWARDASTPDPSFASWSFSAGN